MTRPYKPAHLTPAEWIFVRTDCPTDPDACWVWTGSLNGDGYGKIADGKRLVLVHRLAYETEVGAIPEGMHLDHLCRNRACLRPSHLEPVTSGENARRGSVARGGRNVRKPACRNGHDYTPENTKSRPNGTRECRTCISEARRKRAAA